MANLSYELRRPSIYAAGDITIVLQILVLDRAFRYTNRANN